MIIRPGAIGDLIVSLPALEWLRVEYTEVWVAGQNVPLVRGFDRVRSIASTGLDLVELGGSREMLLGFDSIVSWYGAGRAEFREAVAGLPMVFHRALPGAGCHAVDFYMRQVGGPDGAVPRVAVEEAPARDFVAVHPFSGSAKKNWGLEKFVELAQGLRVEFCAGPLEFLEGALRFESLWDVAKWLRGARAYVGNDSGITHLAAAVGVPVVAIFRDSDVRVWGPRGSRVRVLEGDPTVAEVRRALAEMAGIY